MTRDKGVIKNAALLALTILILLFWMFKGRPDLKTIALYASSNEKIALLSCFALIVFKILAPFFPTALIYMVCGYLLQPWYAIFTCLFANALIFTTSYFGCHTPKNAISKLYFHSMDGFLYSLTLHSVRVIPSNTVGMLFGKINAPFIPCFFGAIFGKLPVVIMSLSLAESLPSTKLSPTSILIILTSLHIVIHRMFARENTKKAYSKLIEDFCDSTRYKKHIKL